MGLTVPDFPTKWNTSTSAYISTTGSHINVYPLMVGPITDVVGDTTVTYSGQWNIVTEFKVYRDKQHRADDPNGQVEIVKVATPAYTEQVVADGIFTLLYNKLKQMFPSGVDDFEAPPPPTEPTSPLIIE